MSILDDEWAGTRWKSEPHVRFGDPCHDCGCPLAPASRCWAVETLPPGVRKHAGHGLCGRCSHRRDKDTPGWRTELRQPEDRAEASVR